MSYILTSHVGRKIERDILIVKDISHFTSFNENRKKHSVLRSIKFNKAKLFISRSLSDSYWLDVNGEFHVIINISNRVTILDENGMPFLLDSCYIPGLRKIDFLDSINDDGIILYPDYFDDYAEIFMVKIKDSLENDALGRLIRDSAEESRFALLMYRDKQ